MKILFQGDSITDAGRDRSDYHNMGSGYPKYAKELIEKVFPNKDIEFINLGISGDRTESLVARLQSDFIDINPDIVSIMIGVNDTWHAIEHGIECPDEYYESNYRKVLTEIKEKTNAKIIMLEQFLLYTEDKKHFRADLNSKMMITRNLAREFCDVYVPLDGLFAAASIDHEPTFWSADGVHPNQNGAEFIAKHYLEAIKTVLKK